MFCVRPLLTLVVLGLCLLQTAAQAEIEAVKGKRYTLTKQHGPWMIMVAAIRDVEDEARRLKDGMSAWQAADQLVYELRRKGIPAYTYVREKKMGEVTSASHSSLDSRQYVAQQGYISVLAGNFPDNTDDRLKKVLDYIKNKFQPEFLTDEKNGGLFSRTPGRPGPLSKAFVTVNPMLSPEELREKTVDKLVLVLNADMEYSLLKNKARYTLVIATFTGNSIMQVGNKADSKAMERFEKSFGSNLDHSGMEAWSLTEALRSAQKLGYDQNYEAWVYHDRNKSVVTIGGFDSPNDPRIQTVATQFRAKAGHHPETGEQTLTPEVFSSPKQPAAGRLPDKMWVFDANPRLMEVPRLKK
jgi:hypothetical protein